MLAPSLLSQGNEQRSCRGERADLDPARLLARLPFEPFFDLATPNTGIAELVQGVTSRTSVAEGIEERADGVDAAALELGLDLWKKIWFPRPPDQIVAPDFSARQRCRRVSSLIHRRTRYPTSGSGPTPQARRLVSLVLAGRENRSFWQFGKLSKSLIFLVSPAGVEPATP